MKERIGESELILNPDGSVFHLHLLPEDIADTIILVGDQDRVAMVSSFFDSIEVQKRNREFITHTGFYKGKRISAVSTGIGTDNIDIVVNELDALVNIDLNTRIPKDEHKTLNLIRIGTSGALQEDIPVDTPVAASIGLGFDVLINYYAGREQISDSKMEEAFMNHTNWDKHLHTPYIVKASDKLLKIVAKDMTSGITISAPGFYGPQGRKLRLETNDPNLNQKLENFKFGDYRITNFEMECSAIYGLSELLGHEALTVCNIIANRYKKQYSSDYKVAVKKLVELILNRTLEL
ncbi:MAG: nucleoside phosphorylase [Bacteroidales bacterium]|nr:nucleoside phosphorylase [Bacteroidales bacterium]